MPTDRSPADLLAFAHQLLDETDAIALRHFAGELTVSAKHDHTLVTQADTEVEERLRTRITDAFPTHGLLGEEYGTEGGGAATRWIIDPIDGTHNFVRGIEVFATLLAVERDGELVAGVVSAPAMRRRWHASVGGGAHVRTDASERHIHVSQVDRLDDAQLVYSTIRGLAEAGLAEGLLHAAAHAWRDRGFGDFWGHMLVAQGSAESMLEYGVHPWDMAAPYVVVTEAGGMMTDLSGVASWSGPQVLTSNGLIHGELLELLAAG